MVSLNNCLWLYHQIIKLFTDMSEKNIRMNQAELSLSNKHNPHDKHVIGDLSPAELATLRVSACQGMEHCMNEPEDWCEDVIGIFCVQDAANDGMFPFWLKNFTQNNKINLLKINLFM